MKDGLGWITSKMAFLQQKKYLYRLVEQFVRRLMKLKYIANIERRL